MRKTLSNSILLLSLICLMSINVQAHNGIVENNNPDESVVLLENESVKYAFVSDYNNYFNSVSFNEGNQYLSLKTFKNVDMIQVLDSEGNLEFQLPISGNLIHISMDDFFKGKYKVNLMFENEKQFITSELIKK